MTTNQLQLERFAARQQGWTRAAAEAWLAAHRAQIAAAGYQPAIVGSVASAGQSAKDLDILLTATTADYDDAQLHGLGAHHHYTDAGERGESLVIHVPVANGFRVVEFFFDYPAAALRRQTAARTEPFWARDWHKGQCTLGRNFFWFAARPACPVHGHHLEDMREFARTHAADERPWRLLTHGGQVLVVDADNHEVLSQITYAEALALCFYHNYDTDAPFNPPRETP